MSILIREARAGDKPAIVELTRTIWEGDDYLPRVFDEWLETATGEFYVMELDDRMAGVGRVQVTDEGDAWLEGCRVHPEVRGQGLASVLFSYQMHVVRRLGCGVARFTTAVSNEPVQHLASVTGFEKITDSFLFQGDPVGEFTATVLGQAERHVAWDMIQSSDWWQATDGMKCESWEWVTITPRRFEEWLENDLVWGWMEQGRLAGVMVASENRQWDEATCGLITGSEAALVGLAGALRGWAVGRHKYVGAVIPQALSAAREAFATAGVRLVDDLQQSLFKKVMKT